MDGRPRAVALVAVLALPAGARVSAQDPPVRVLGARPPGFDAAVRTAVADATAQLRRDPCRSILLEFRDERGRPLREGFDALGGDPEALLRTLIFVNGDNEAACRSVNVLAGTRPGSRVLHLCGRRFTRLQFRDPALAATVILHEALHSLGLGENPPSSVEITETVHARCGR
jgi:hypothetical protein